MILEITDNYYKELFQYRENISEILLRYEMNENKLNRLVIESTIVDTFMVSQMVLIDNTFRHLSSGAKEIFGVDVKIVKSILLTFISEYKFFQSKRDYQASMNRLSPP